MESAIAKGGNVVSSLGRTRGDQGAGGQGAHPRLHGGLGPRTSRGIGEGWTC